MFVFSMCLCVILEFLEFLAMSRDSELLSSAKKSWSKKLPDGNKLKTEILPLLNEVAKAEGAFFIMLFIYSKANFALFYLLFLL